MSNTWDQAERLAWLFYFMELNMDLKKPYTIKEQIDKIRDHGIIISDENFATKMLMEISYYRLSGYMLQYRVSTDSHEMVTGIHFETIYKIYSFDEEIRALLRMYIEKAEFYYKCLIGNNFAELKCQKAPYDQHYDIRNYYDKGGIESTLQNFSKEKKYYKDSAIVKHHYRKYADKMPIWVMMELMTLSSVSFFYHALYQSDKDAIAKQIGISSSTLENHLHALSVLRNKCSHGVRLYNSVMNPPVRFNKSFLRGNPTIKNNSLFAYILMLTKRLPSDKDRKMFRDKLNRIIKKYEADIDLSLVGFPDDYKKFLYLRSIKGIR